MKLVLPMAGYGTRLRPLTWSRPKPLLAVAGKPVLGHVLDMYAMPFDLEEVIFIVGYLGDQIKAYVDQTYPHLNARYVEQPEMKGQSHAIWLARQRLVGPMVMLFVDTLIEADLGGLDEEEAGAIAWVKEIDDPRRFGVADVGEDDLVQRLIEKPQDPSINLAVVGCYYFKQSELLIAAIKEQMDRQVQLKGEFYLVDAINIMLDQGLSMRVRTVDVWEDCGKPDAMLQTNRFLLDQGRDNSAEAARREDVQIVAPVYVHPSAEIRHSTIGPHVSLGAGCIIESSSIQDSIIEDRAHISSSEISGSLVGQDAQVIGQRARLIVGDDSIVGPPTA